MSWSSKKQYLVARSSTEAEYCALSQITPDLLWLESLLRNLMCHFNLILYFVIILALLLSHNSILHAQTKHIELDIDFVRELVILKLLKIQHVSSSL